MKNIFSCLVAVGCLAMPCLADDDAAVEKVKKVAFADLERQMTSWVDQAEVAITDGDYYKAHDLLDRALSLDTHKKTAIGQRAKALRKFNDKMIDKVGRVLAKRDREKDWDALDAANRMTYPDDRLGRLKYNMPHKGAAWKAAIGKSLKGKVAFKASSSGQDAVNALRNTFNVNIVVTKDVKDLSAYKGKQDFNFKNMSGTSILNNVAKEWGVSWYLEDEAVVFGSSDPTKGGALSAYEAKVASEYVPPDFPSNQLDMGPLGLKDSRPGPGLGERDNYKVIPYGAQVVLPDGTVNGGGNQSGDFKVGITADGKKILVRD